MPKHRAECAPGRVHQFHQLTIIIENRINWRPDLAMTEGCLINSSDSVWLGCHSVDAIRWMPFSGYNRCHPTHAILLMRAVQSPVGVCTPQSLPGNQRYIPFPPAIASSIYTVPSSDCQSSLAFASHFIRRIASCGCLLHTTLDRDAVYRHQEFVYTHTNRERDSLSERRLVSCAKCMCWCAAHGTRLLHTTPPKFSGASRYKVAWYWRSLLIPNLWLRSNKSYWLLSIPVHLLVRKSCYRSRSAAFPEVRFVLSVQKEFEKQSKAIRLIVRVSLLVRRSFKIIPGLISAPVNFSQLARSPQLLHKSLIEIVVRSKTDHDVFMLQKDRSLRRRWMLQMCWRL